MDEKILVVDDHHDVVETISGILRKSGHSVETACSGQECLEKMEEQNIKLLFLDIMMPDISGYHVAEKLRANYNNHIKIIYVTIKPKAEVDMTHADGFIQKPFWMEDILAAARQHLG